MNEEKKSKWVKMLDEAGLLDEIEDGWSIKGRPHEGSTITVDGSRVSVIPTSVAPPPREPRDTQPRRPESRRAEPQEMPRTPVERLRSSSPARRPSGDDVGGNGQPLIAVSSAKRTAIGLPVGSIPSLPSLPSDDPASSFPDLYEASKVSSDSWAEAVEEDAAARATKDQGEELELIPESDPPPLEDRSEHMVRVGSRRISVAPESVESTPEREQGAIVDEPMSYERPPLASEIPPVRDAEREARDLFAVGDYSGALAVIEEILADTPDDPMALRMREECRGILMGMYESRIGSFDRVPKAKVNEHEIVWRNLDPSTGFVLSRIDGMTTFDEVIDISGLPRFETCRILDRLLQDGIIE